MTGIWIYNIILKCWQWYSGGKVYADRSQVPINKRPYYDPGKPFNKVSKA